MTGLLMVKSGSLIFPATAETSPPHTDPKKESAKSVAPDNARKDQNLLDDKKKSDKIPYVESIAGINKSTEIPVTDSERNLLVELRQRRVAVEAREAAIVKREITFQAVEKRLASRLGELTDLQKRLEDLERQRKERDEGSWRGLVKLYETMKPKDAATIFNDLEPSVLIPVMDRMKEGKAAMIMSSMLPERARLVTTELASQRTKANAAPVNNDSDVSKAVTTRKQ